MRLRTGRRMRTRAAEKQKEEFEDRGFYKQATPNGVKTTYQLPSTNSEVMFCARSVARSGRPCRSTLDKSEPTLIKVKPVTFLSKSTLPELRSTAFTCAERVRRKSLGVRVSEGAKLRAALAYSVSVPLTMISPGSCVAN